MEATPIWEPSGAVAQEVAAAVSTELETAMLAAIRALPETGESHLASATRRELAIAALFNQLDVVTAYHLARRLDIRRPEDELATAFHQRLGPERRARLRTYLAGARRRAALQR
ncbi:MAG: hypothetical protein ABI867_26920 [Kofleriaceae bacterium]